MWRWSNNDSMGAMDIGVGVNGWRWCDMYPNLEGEEEGNAADVIRYVVL